MRIFLMLALVLGFPVSAYAGEIIDISVKGISDQTKDGAQKDRQEAIMDAKRQACEKAGLKIKSQTAVEDFAVVFDYVESKAETVLLPGFQLIDIGYVADGTYQVVLSGKIQIIEEDEAISAKELRYAKSLRQDGKYAACGTVLKKYIDAKDGEVSEALREEASYLYIRWGYAWNPEDSIRKFLAYYPDSKYSPTLLRFGDFISKPITEYDQTFSHTAKEWQEASFTYRDKTFTQKIAAGRDVLVIKDFKGDEKTILIELNLYQNQDGEKPASAYELIIKYGDGKSDADNVGELKEIENRVALFSPAKNKTNTFQHSASGKRFANFGLKNFMIKGEVPFGDGPFEQRLTFKVVQSSF